MLFAVFRAHESNQQQAISSSCFPSMPSYQMGKMCILLTQAAQFSTVQHSLLQSLVTHRRRARARACLCVRRFPRKQTERKKAAHTSAAKAHTTGVSGVSASCKDSLMKKRKKNPGVENYTENEAKENFWIFSKSAEYKISLLIYLIDKKVKLHFLIWIQKSVYIIEL